MSEYPWTEDEVLEASAKKKRQATFPANHQPGMRVPQGGSSCESCEYLKDPEKRICGNPYFVKWNGSATIPAPIDSYCSDWYEPEEQES